MPRRPPGAALVPLILVTGGAGYLGRRETIEAVVHCAGSIQVGESLEKPACYRGNDDSAAVAFFPTAPRGLRVVCSSTAAVYGEPERVPIPESHPLRPINPYGHTKPACEHRPRTFGFALTVLRYFNSVDGEVGDNEDERHASNPLSREASPP